jgi:hypothetical protein
VNKLLITGCFILFSLRCFATCIAIYLAPNGHIYVAADSRRTFYFDDDKARFETICKIHHVGNSYFAVAGIDDEGLTNGASLALEETGNIDDALKVFGAAMCRRYTQLMSDARQLYPERFKKFLSDGLAEVSFFGFYDGKPKIQDVEFRLRLDKKNQVVVSYEIQSVGYFTVIGMSNDIFDGADSGMPDKQVMLQNPVLYVEGLVKLEARKHPLSVGEPIDLLELKPEGVVWIRKNETTSSS